MNKPNKSARDASIPIGCDEVADLVRHYDLTYEIGVGGRTVVEKADWVLNRPAHEMTLSDFIAEDEEGILYRWGSPPVYGVARLCWFVHASRRTSNHEAL